MPLRSHNPTKDKAASASEVLTRSEFCFARYSTEDAERARNAMTRKASGVCAESAALYFNL